MKVSVIVPNYNHERFLKQRLESIFNQTYTDFEILLLDDKSTDSSVEYLKSIENHPKVKCLDINTENSGSPFSQWYKGFSHAAGELIWIAESDDFSEPNFLEKMVPAFSDPEVILSFCNSAIVDEKGLILQDRNAWADAMDAEKWKINFFENGKDYLLSHQRYRNTISNASGVVFRKSALKKINQHPEKFSYTGDWLFWNQICFQGKIAFLSESLNFWRSHSESTRRINSLEEEFKKLAENTNTIELTNALFDDQSPMEIHKLNWILDWWLSRFSYKNLLNKLYTSPPLPTELKPFFRKKLRKRTIEAFKKSLFRKK